ncbi:MAG: 50S ribosomal protein L1, partial [Candidatus Latescibacteria bacterium]|nr:50S ribosomal protein L1 [Candidatus Latescibacterota bacterium]
MHRAKRYVARLNTVDRKTQYPLGEAVRMLKAMTSCGFDETVEVAVRLGVDPRRADQVVRGTVLLPYGTGRRVTVLVLTRGELEVEAREAGADHVGAEEYIQKISEGWVEFDIAIASPDMMGSVGKLGRILGPRGLMPNPK